MSKKSRHGNVSLPRPNPPPVVTQQTTTKQWSGPVPPPEVLSKFNDAIPGGATRILEMAEKEQQHRIAREATAIDAMVADTKRGQWLGAAVAVASIAGAVGTAMAGAHWVVSAALVSVPVMAMIRSLITGRSKDDPPTNTP